MGGPRPQVFSGPATICRIDLFEILDLESWPMNKFICCYLGLDGIQYPRCAEQTGINLYSAQHNERRKNEDI